MKKPSEFSWSCRKVIDSWCITLESSKYGTQVSTLIFTTKIDELRAAVFELKYLIAVRF